jgi:hypothetical protein
LEWGDVPDGLVSRGHLNKDGSVPKVWLDKAKKK